jgi:hypothetical protein
MAPSAACSRILAFIFSVRVDVDAHSGGKVSWLFGPQVREVDAADDLIFDLLGRAEDVGAVLSKTVHTPEAVHHRWARASNYDQITSENSAWK